MQVLGLGDTPEKVIVNGNEGIYCPATDTSTGGSGSLDTFWRSVENLTTGAGESGTLWAVSQAAPLRRVNIINDLVLHDNGQMASGGFVADSKINGKIILGSQQQFCFRDCEATGVSPAAWNQVFIGGKRIESFEIVKWIDDSKQVFNYSLSNLPSDSYVEMDNKVITKYQPAGSVVIDKERNVTTGLPAHSQILQTPLIAQKPFISFDNGLYFLNVPELSPGIVDKRDFARCFVAKPSDSTDLIQLALDSGLDLVLSPGIYSLADTLVLRVKRQVVLAIGMATLIAPRNAKPAIFVPANLTGIRLAGLFIEASAPTYSSTLPVRHSTLLQWGTRPNPLVLIKENYGSKADPAGFLYDLFCRVGGSNTDKRVSVDTIVSIHSNWVVGDNLWLWRADHAALEANEKPKPFEKYHLVKEDEYRCNQAIEVTGKFVYMYGLACEHTQKANTLWSGENGSTFFYQCELPYDLSQESIKSCCGYRLTTYKHEAVGLGVYCYFRDHCTVAENGIQFPRQMCTPKPMSGYFLNSFTRFLNGNFGSGIAHVINNVGSQVGLITDLESVGYTEDNKLAIVADHRLMAFEFITRMSSN